MQFSTNPIYKIHITSPNQKSTPFVEHAFSDLILRIHDNDKKIIVLPMSEFFLINISYC